MSVDETARGKVHGLTTSLRLGFLGFGGSGSLYGLLLNPRRNAFETRRGCWLLAIMGWGEYGFGRVSESSFV